MDAKLFVPFGTRFKSQYHR